MLVVKAYLPAKESFGFTANLKSQIAASVPLMRV